MKIFFATTTIHIPRALAVFSKTSYRDHFFCIAGDRKTPDLKVVTFLEDVPNHAYYGIDYQLRLGYTCSQLIGENCVERRNIALLEAVRLGADVIVFWDNDNFCSGVGYFEQMSVMANLYAGLCVSSSHSWVDPGCLLVPQTKHRGFPIDIKPDPIFSPVVDARIGVCAGLVLGDPDIDAVTRIATAPSIHQVSELARTGVVTDPRITSTVFNSQNTAFVRELAPAMFQPPGVGRYSDIYASLICQRVMAERNLHVHFGQPFVWQQRNAHNLVDDLRQEIDGMANVQRFGEWLRLARLRDGSTLDQTRQLYAQIGKTDFMPEAAVAAANAYLDDIEMVMQ